MVHRVHHFGTQGTQGAPFWYTGCTGCTILVHRVHHFGTQGAPFWYTGCTILVHRVHHFGTQGAPSRVGYPFALPHNYPKTNPIPETPTQIITELLRKAPQKPLPGLTARLSSPTTQTGLRRWRQRTTTVTPHTPAGTKNHDGNGSHTGRGSHPPRGSEQHPTKAGSPTTAESQTPARWRPSKTGSTVSRRRAQPGSPRSSRPNRGQVTQSVRQNRQETSDPTHTSGTQDRTLHTAASTKVSSPSRPRTS